MDLETVMQSEINQTQRHYVFSLTMWKLSKEEKEDHLKVEDGLLGTRKAGQQAEGRGQKNGEWTRSVYNVCMQRNVTVKLLI